MRLPAVGALCGAALMGWASTQAAADFEVVPGISVYSDFRHRFEEDWDSRRSDGTLRQERTRGRIRARVGVKVKPAKGLEFNVRARTGPGDSQQSPHITIYDLDDNGLGPGGFNLDKWYGKGTSGGASLWVGRNEIQYWKQNELFWDDDATVVGLGLQLSRTLQAGMNITFNGGYYALPAGMQALSGSLGSAQVVVKSKVHGVDLTAAGGGLLITADPDDKHAALLLTGNGMRDYAILIGQVQAKFNPGIGPVTLGLDVMQNVQDYSSNDPDPFTAANANQKTGFVLSAIYGQLKKRGDWLAGYYYADIEALAINASYAQDDWMRWGTATQTRASDFKGHEIRLGIAFSDKINLLSRLYMVESLTSVEDGKRARFDLNVKF